MVGRTLISIGTLTHYMNYPEKYSFQGLLYDMFIYCYPIPSNAIRTYIYILVLTANLQQHKQNRICMIIMGDGQYHDLVTPIHIAHIYSSIGTRHEFTCCDIVYFIYHISDLCERKCG